MRDLACPACGENDWEVYDEDGVGNSERCLTYNVCLACNEEFIVEYQLKNIKEHRS